MCHSKVPVLLKYTVDWWKTSRRLSPLERLDESHPQRWRSCLGTIGDIQATFCPFCKCPC